jgi:phosphoribosylformimino-5-aminoimidazole carboxamide ribotide isomerase
VKVNKMTRFRPCIDLHAGSVKQIVGGTLSTTAPDVLKTNWTSEHPSAYYAHLYKQYGLTGAHVIMLGPGNDQAAKEALEAWKEGMQVGGGITDKNAREWIEKGAERVSYHKAIEDIARKLMRLSVGHHNILPFP